MSSTGNRLQNRMLNCEKALACILVIVLHCEFPTFIGSIINIVARISVPLFFMIAGYFAISLDNYKTQLRLKNKIVRTLKIVAIYYFINIIFEIIVKCNILKVSTIDDLTELFINLDNIKDTVLWNRTLIGIGGWFLPALAFCYIIAYCLHKKSIMQIAHRFIIPLFIIYFFISRMTSLPVWYSRNYLFDGMPFFLLGNYVAMNRSKLETIKNNVLVVATLGGVGLACLERFTGGYDLYVGVIIATFVIFLFAINNEQLSLGRHIEYVGEKLNLHCYLVHSFVLQFLWYIEGETGLNGMVYQWVRPIVVIICTLVLAQLIFITGCRFRKKK